MEGDGGGGYMSRDACMDGKMEVCRGAMVLNRGGGQEGGRAARKSGLAFICVLSFPQRVRAGAGVWFWLSFVRFGGAVGSITSSQCMHFLYFFGGGERG
jgi:hypothetical protein